MKSQFKLDMLELKQPQPTVQVAALRLRLGCAALPGYKEPGDIAGAGYHLNALGTSCHLGTNFLLRDALYVSNSSLVG